MKPDMKVNSQMREMYYKPHMYGHIAGTAPGDVFYGKGELAIIGIHRTITKGIDFL